MEGDVPTPHGTIHVAMDVHQITVKATEGEGYLYLRSAHKPLCGQAEVDALDGSLYRVKVEKDKEIKVEYTAETN